MQKLRILMIILKMIKNLIKILKNLNGLKVFYVA